jgi:hypothetical protein
MSDDHISSARERPVLGIDDGSVLLSGARVGGQVWHLYPADVEQEAGARALGR